MATLYNLLLETCYVIIHSVNDHPALCLLELGDKLKCIFSPDRRRQLYVTDRAQSTNLRG